MGLVFISLLLYQAWQQDYAPDTTPIESSYTPTLVSETPTPLNTDAELPTPPKDVQVGAVEVPTTEATRLLQSSSRIKVETDVFKITIDTTGGDIRQVGLIEYPNKRETPEDPFMLMNDTLPNLFIAQSGLLPKESAPTHQAVYHSDQSHYKMIDDQLKVILYWFNADKSIKVSKVYTFERGSYDIDIKHIVENNTVDNPWHGRLYGQFQRTESDVGQNSFTYTYMGGAVSSPDQLYEKIPFDDIEDNSFNDENRPGWSNGWAAMLQHYFVGAFIPKRDQVDNYYTRMLPAGQRHVLGFYGPTQTVAPGEQHTFQMTLYVGPKVQEKLEALSPGLELTVDYGWLWFLAQPLFWMLKTLYEWIGNWGWAIIILTIMIKMVFFQLSAASYKSMANMRRLQPRLVSLKERYGDDKARLNQAMMDMYKKEKINPLGGCLPILIQIPVFIALYWVLLESVELRQAPFILWLTDLSAQDPYFVLPVIMGATMLVQHHLNPAPIDPVQQKVMMVLPIVFTVFFAFFPAGLVLYWVVNNILSIAQQWVITKKIAGNVM